MPVVLRRRIDTVAFELMTLAEEVRETSPTLAEVYRAIGQGLDSSHYKLHGGHDLYFDLPAGCIVNVAGKTTHQVEGPAILSLRPREEDTFR